MSEGFELLFVNLDMGHLNVCDNPVLVCAGAVRVSELTCATSQLPLLGWVLVCEFFHDDWSEPFVVDECPRTDEDTRWDCVIRVLRLENTFHHCH